MRDNKNIAEKLADLIEANPDCKFHIDNDVWYMLDKDGNEIAESGGYGFATNWYSGSSLYGAGIADALVILLNRKGFNIQASAV